MKILMFTHEFAPFPGGIARYAVELARAAAKLGHEVHVVAPDYGDRAAGQADQAEPFVVYRQKAGFYQSRRFPWLIAEVARYLGRGPWDIVHAVDSPYVVGLAFYSRLIPTVFQCMVHGTDILTLPAAGTVRLLVGGDPFGRSSRVCCNSAFTRGLLHATFPHLPAAKSVVTHLGVSDYWLAPASAEDIDRTQVKLGLSGTENVVLTVARLEERKGHLLTLEALGLLWQRGIRNFVYVIVGTATDEAYERKVRTRAGEAPFTVTFAGRLPEEEVRAAYSLADVFCLPGLDIADRVEGFGLAYLEAAAQGLPAVGTRVNAVPEVVKDQETGLLISEPSPQALSAALEKVLASESLRFSLGEAARRWALEFTWEECALKTFLPV